MELEGDDYKVRIGETVRERLLADPSVLQIPSANLEIFVAREFLTPGECAALIRLIDRNRMPSQLLSPSSDPDFRTSESCNLDPADRTVVRVERKIADLMGIEPAHGETIQGQRYAVGQQFKEHHDFFHIGEPYWDEMERCGGQRTWTAMIFLNQPEGGGQTAFPEAGIKVAPRAGNLLTWNNMTPEGHPNRFTLHQGMPVTEGVKYVITKWHRERPWKVSSVPTY